MLAALLAAQPDAGAQPIVKIEVPRP